MGGSEEEGVDMGRLGIREWRVAGEEEELGRGCGHGSGRRGVEWEGLGEEKDGLGRRRETVWKWKKCKEERNGSEKRPRERGICSLGKTGLIQFNCLSSP